MPKSLAEAIEYAKIIANTDIVPRCFKGKYGDVLVAIQLGAEVGLPPLSALQNIAVINGRPSIWGDALLALVQAHNSFEHIRESLDVATMTATCEYKRRGMPPIIRTFSKADAETARLWTKEGPWKQYPKRMLQMRARGFALRDGASDILRGIASREEVMDISADDVIEMEQEAVTTPKTQTEKVKDKLKKGGAKETLTVTAIVERINSAKSKADLQAVAELAKSLASETDRETTREAYKTKLAEIAATKTEFAQQPLPQDGSVDGERETLLTQLYGGIGVIGDQKWECIRAELGLPKSTDGYSVDQIKQAIRGVNKEADKKAA